MNQAQVDLYWPQPESPAKGGAVRTDALNAEEFVDAFAEALFAAIGTKEEHKPLFVSWINDGMELLLKIKGYKAERVNERRIMWCGEGSPYHADHVASNVDATGVLDKGYE